MLSGAPSMLEHHQFCWRIKEEELTFQFFLAWKRPLEKINLLSPQPTPVLLPGNSHGQRSLMGAVHGVAKSRTRLSDFTSTFHFHALEKEMATHSSVLAWRIPGTGEPGGLPSTGSHRVRHH